MHSVSIELKMYHTISAFKCFELTDVLEDAGISGGKNKGREGFISLLNAVESKQIDVLVIYSLERLSRDMLTLLLFERLLDERAIELHTVEGLLDTSTPDGWMGFAMRSFLGEIERRQVKYRTKKAMAYKKSQGSVVGSIPYGFTRQADSLIQNMEELAVIQKINKLYGKGISLYKICEVLNNAGIKTRNGHDWQPVQISRLINGYETQAHRSTFAKNIAEFIQKVA
jgi:site-specific DNA recombinase